MVTNKTNQVRFFEKTFLLANVCLKIILGISFLILNGANVDFLDQKLWWRTYTIKKTLSTTRYVELMGKKKFATIALDSEYKIFVVHVASFGSTPLNADINSFRKPHISSLITEKASIKVSNEYVDFADVFSPILASNLPEHTKINNHAIKLVNIQQSFYGPIYSLGLVELENLKAYIKTNLANKFIKLFKSTASALILFN